MLTPERTVEEAQRFYSHCRGISLTAVLPQTTSDERKNDGGGRSWWGGRHHHQQSTSQFALCWRYFYSNWPSPPLNLISAHFPRFFFNRKLSFQDPPESNCLWYLELGHLPSVTCLQQLIHILDFSVSVLLRIL